MIIPLWAVLTILGTFCTAAMMLLQERFKVEGFALSIWCKVACIVATFPLVMIVGLPSDPRFYLYLSLQALMFAINDVIMFRAIPVVGAAVVSRLIPSTIIFSFLLWFIVDPALFSVYLERPVITAMIFFVILLTAYFAMRMTKCHVSMAAVRKLWFVITANTLGWIVAKMAISYSPAKQAAVAFTFVEAWMMIALWMLYLFIAKPIKPSALLDKATIKGGLIIGVAMAAGMLFIVTATHHIDNPGYISAIKILDAVIIVGVHRLMGKTDGSDKIAGFGIVACAIVLVLLKAQI